MIVRRQWRGHAYWELGFWSTRYPDQQFSDSYTVVHFYQAFSCDSIKDHEDPWTPYPCYKNSPKKGRSNEIQDIDTFKYSKGRMSGWITISPATASKCRYVGFLPGTISRNSIIYALCIKRFVLESILVPNSCFLWHFPLLLCDP